MGPYFFDIGDEVCLIFGIKVPMVLRKQGEYWRLLGDAYVHGIMEVSS